jgi:hypothetical protein
MELQGPKGGAPSASPWKELQGVCGTAGIPAPQGRRRRTFFGAGAE